MDYRQRYGPWAVIAGASEGTGRAFAIRLARQGIGCLLVARRRQPLGALADEIRAEGAAPCEILEADLASDDALDRIAAFTGDREVGLYVANAGADPNGARFLDRDIDTWLSLVRRNILTTMKACHHFGAQMKLRGHGGLLLVNSGACYGGASFMATYSASKAFELAFAEGLWAELSGHGVDVLSLVLGQTDTPAFRALLAEKNMPVPDGIALPDDVARVGLERLPFGPVHNWGAADTVRGFAPMSAAERRARVQAIDQASRHVFGSDEAL